MALPSRTCRCQSSGAVMVIRCRVVAEAPSLRVLGLVVAAALEQEALLPMDGVPRLDPDLAAARARLRCRLDRGQAPAGWGGGARVNEESHWNVDRRQFVGEVSEHKQGSILTVHPLVNTHYVAALACEHVMRFGEPGGFSKKAEW